MKRLLIAFAFCVIAVPAWAQAPTFTAKFQVSAKVLSVPGLSQVAIATDAGGTFAITSKLALREDSIIVPSDNATAYIGGVQYDVTSLFAKALKKTLLPQNAFQAYLAGGIGVDRVGTSHIVQHIATHAGGGVNYDPSGMGHFNVNLFELRWARLPGVANNSLVFSSGINISF